MCRKKVKTRAPVFYLSSLPYRSTYGRVINANLSRCLSRLPKTKRTLLQLAPEQCSRTQSRRNRYVVALRLQQLKSVERKCASHTTITYRRFRERKKWVCHHWPYRCRFLNHSDWSRSTWDLTDSMRRESIEYVDSLSFRERTAPSQVIKYRLSSAAWRTPKQKTTWIIYWMLLAIVKPRNHSIS